MAFWSKRDDTQSRRSLQARVDRLEERISLLLEQVEQRLLENRATMATITEACEDMLDRATKKAQVARSQARRDQQAVEQNSEQTLDPEEERWAMLRATDPFRGH